ncbi:SUF system Fe-S cluster assembly protein [Maricaulis maris]|jgi:FeS assembly SUF system protein|uniref:SUF system Fe-S cluster assembly protein n=1 Tax=Maricaulis maris TaxID=74318 RepID=UPI002923F72A|nr:SUF system Fe-S cluster assembly protein [Maricaulis maris]
MTDRTDRDVIDLSAPAAPAAPVTEEPVAKPADGTGAIPAGELARITDDIVTALKSVYDPEIPVDIYELGLIYKVDLEDDRTLKVQMSLTAPGCPVAGEMPGWVQDAVEKVDGVEKALVDLTFDPPWTPDRMSDEARLALNMF